MDLFAKDMMSTKKEVDKYVRKLSAKKRSRQGFMIAENYFRIGQYRSALKFVDEFLKSNERNDAALKLKLQCTKNLKRIVDESNFKCLQWLQRCTETERKLFKVLLKCENLSEATELIIKLDSYLIEAPIHCNFLGSNCQFIAECLKNFQGQLSLHIASLIFLKSNPGKETTSKAMPLLLFACNTAMFNSNQLIFTNISEKIKEWLDLWHVESQFRLIQAAVTLQSSISSIAVKNNGQLHFLQRMYPEKLGSWAIQNDLFDQIRHEISDVSWCEYLYRNIAAGTQFENEVLELNLIKNGLFQNLTYRLPDSSQLNEICSQLSSTDPKNLAFLVYLGLAMEFSNNSPCFDWNKLNLPFSKPDIMNQLSFLLNPGTMCQLDAETFVYATMIQTKSYFDVKPNDVPSILPYAVILKELATQDQKNYWNAALSGDQQNLAYGFDLIDVTILLKMGKMFINKSKNLLDLTQRGLIEKHAITIYKFALKMIANQHSSENLIFKYNGQFSYNELAEEGIIFLANKHFEKKSYEECIGDLHDVSFPFAAYFQAEAFRMLSQSEGLSDEMRSSYEYHYSERLRAALEQLVAAGLSHPLHSIIDIQFEEMPIIQILHEPFVSTENNESDFICVNPLPEFETNINSVTAQKNVRSFFESFGESLDGASLEPNAHQQLDFVAPDSTSMQEQVLEKPIEEPLADKPDASPDISSTSEMAELEQPVQVDRAVFKEFSKKVRCPIKGCSSKFAHKKNIKRHIDSKHGTLIEGGQYALKRYVCKICKTSNVYESNFELHFEEKHRELDMNLMKENLVIKTQIVPPLKYRK